MNARPAPRHPSPIRWLGGALFLACLVAAACTPAAGGPPAASPEPEPSRATLADCPITRPDPAFKALAPWPEDAPARYGAAWFGSEALWTMIDVDGEVWMDLPPDGSGFGQKTWWWSTAFESGEFEPAIVVNAERIDAPGSATSNGLGTNGSADFGRAMLQVIVIPTEGCWRLTGTYRGESLSYVVWVGPFDG